MPIKNSAKKALRKSDKKAEYNLKIREDLKTLIKKTKKAIEIRDSKDKIEEMLKKVQIGVDKAVQKGVIKKNTGSRRVSRLMKLYKKGGQSVIKKDTADSQSAPKEEPADK